MGRRDLFLLLLFSRGFIGRLRPHHAANKVGGKTDMGPEEEPMSRQFTQFFDDNPLHAEQWRQVYPHLD